MISGMRRVCCTAISFHTISQLRLQLELLPLKLLLLLLELLQLLELLLLLLLKLR